MLVQVLVIAGVLLLTTAAAFSLWAVLDARQEHTVQLDPVLHHEDGSPPYMLPPLITWAEQEVWGMTLQEVADGLYMTFYGESPAPHTRPIPVVQP
jgi:hypothetical protein